ncbi:MAG: glycosyltransferase family 2 protein [Candidatus Hydrogenedentota bacterium]|nr:MAG: glycosyltransferase family 2 protein [Candidatus Hydrogenedentota bacterium]
MKPDLSLVIACYRDANHLERNVIQIRDLLAATRWKVEWIFVEDAGEDGSLEIIRRLAKETVPGAKMIFHEKNSGRGKAVRDGFAVANGRVLGFIDIDLAVGPVYIPLMVHRILHDGYDVAVAWRIYRTSFHPSNLVRDFLSYGYRLLTRIVLSLPFHDTEAGYKFFRAECLPDLLRHATNPGWFWDTELMLYSHLLGLKVIEEPCLYRRDKDKASTVHIFADTFHYLKNLHHLRKRGHSSNLSISRSPEPRHKD